MEAPSPIETATKVEDADRPKPVQKKRQGRGSLRIVRPSSVATNVASPGSGVSV